jgi:uncharacterized protein
MRSSRRWALAGAAAALACRPAAAQMQLPPPQGYVNDFAHVIAPAYADSLRAVIDDVRRQSGGEIVVVTLPSLNGRPASEVALQIGREWKIGQKGDPTDRDRATGVVVLLGMKERAWRIETGTGTETFIGAPEAGRIGRDLMVPELKAGHVGRALLLGVDSLAGDYAHQFGFTLASAPAATAGAPEPAHADPVVEEVPDESPASGRNLALAIGGALLFLLAIAGVHRLVRGSTGPQLDHWRRNRRRAPGPFARDAWDDDPRPYRERPAGLTNWGGSTAATGPTLLGGLLDDDSSSSSGGGSLFGGDGGGSIFGGDSGSSSDDDRGGFGGSGDFSGGGSGGTW